MPRARTWIGGIVMASLAAACSVFSGWGDLQEGDGSRDAGRSDGGSPTKDGGSGTDGAGADDAETIGNLPSVPCGSSTCTLGKGCCITQGGGQSCTADNQCAGDTYFGCVDRRSCVRFLGAGAICCFSSAGRESSCEFGPCQAGHIELCDSTAALPCSGGQCTVDFGINGVKACQ